jgi:hypothetical protein
MRHPELLQELNLDVSTEEFLSAERAFTYADLFATLGNQDTAAWLTPRGAVFRRDERGLNVWEQLDGFYGFYFSADGIEIVAAARSLEHLLEICDIVLRLLAGSVVHSVKLSNIALHDGSINAPSLAYLMEQCQSLKSLTLSHISFDEDNIRALCTYFRPDLDIVLHSCPIRSSGASALAEVLGRNQGPTSLVCCDIDNLVLAGGLRGNSRLKSLRLRYSSDLEVGNREILGIAGSLRGNKGLTELNLSWYGFRMTDETWDAVCDSVKTHPTLEVLHIRSMFMDTTTAPEVLKSRIQALVDMLKVNMSIRTIHLNDRHREHELFRGSVIPYLETNRFRPRLLAIQKTRPITYRTKILGRALFAVRADANSFWMLLSGNPEVVFPSTTVPAANLPTAATTDATSNAAPVAATAAVTVTATRAPSTTNATATSATVATPTAHQKRKARN